MKTYSETCGETPFNWNKALDACIQNEPSDSSRASLEDKSALWTTCACGNQCEVIPRAFNGQPKDFLLKCLGRDFHSYVRWGCWTEAKETLSKIEARSAIVIRETLANLNQP